ncbi:MAG: hypothetical protein HY582_05135 [Candidatus Omnitrophica bacterium]|nr:hypothetical protein [Candidatus Omnitrophota bacterium]
MPAKTFALVANKELQKSSSAKKTSSVISDTKPTMKPAGGVIPNSPKIPGSFDIDSLPVCLRLGQICSVDGVVPPIPFPECALGRCMPEDWTHYQDARDLYCAPPPGCPEAELPTLSPGRTPRIPPDDRECQEWERSYYKWATCEQCETHCEQCPDEKFPNCTTNCEYMQIVRYSTSSSYRGFYPQCFDFVCDDRPWQCSPVDPAFCQVEGQVCYVHGEMSGSGSQDLCDYGECNGQFNCERRAGCIDDGPEGPGCDDRIVTDWSHDIIEKIGEEDVLDNEPRPVVFEIPAGSELKFNVTALAHPGTQTHQEMLQVDPDAAIPPLPPRPWTLPEGIQFNRMTPDGSVYAFSWIPNANQIGTHHLATTAGLVSGSCPTILRADLHPIQIKVVGCKMDEDCNDQERCTQDQCDLSANACKHTYICRTFPPQG